MVSRIAGEIQGDGDGRQVLEIALEEEVGGVMALAHFDRIQVPPESARYGERIVIEDSSIGRAPYPN